MVLLQHQPRKEKSDEHSERWKQTGGWWPAAGQSGWRNEGRRLALDDRKPLRGWPQQRTFEIVSFEAGADLGRRRPKVP